MQTLYDFDTTSRGLRLAATQVPPNLLAGARASCADVLLWCLSCRAAVAILQSEWPTLSLSSGGIFSISTFALSLLLVFRTNSSYEVRPT